MKVPLVFFLILLVAVTCSTHTGPFVEDNEADRKLLDTWPVNNGSVQYEYEGIYEYLPDIMVNYDENRLHPFLENWVILVVEIPIYTFLSIVTPVTMLSIQMTLRFQRRRFRKL